MSWNFTHVGTRQAVADKVAKENYVPESLKRAIAEIVMAPTAPNTTNGVKVYTHGHVDQFSSTVKLEIEGFNLVLDAPVAPPAPASEAPAAPSPLKTG